MNKLITAQRCKDCGKILRDHNKSKLCTFHLVRSKKRKHLITFNNFGAMVYLCNGNSVSEKSNITKNPKEATCKGCIKINKSLKKR